MLVQIGKPTAGDGNGESRGAAAAPVNGPPLLPTDYKVGAEIQPGVGVDVTAGGAELGDYIAGSSSQSPGGSDTG
jgi:hypothetical protein